MTAVTDFEYPSPEVVECPYPFYDALRREAPVHRLPTGQYLVSRWVDVVSVLRQPELFSNAIGSIGESAAGGANVGGRTEGGRYTPWPLPFSDPPEHRLKRALCLQ